MFEKTAFFYIIQFTNKFIVPWSNAFWPGLTLFGPLLWQAEADTEMTPSDLPTTLVVHKALAMAKRRYSTVGTSCHSYLISKTSPSILVCFRFVPPQEDSQIQNRNEISRKIKGISCY